MALSPLKNSPSYSSSRRRSGGWGTFLLIVAGLGLLFWAYRAIRGFDPRVKKTMALARAEKLGEAATRLAALELEKPGDPRVQDAQGLLALRSGKLEEAREAYQKLAPGAVKEAYGEIHEKEGAWHLGRGDYASAEIEYSRASAIDPGNAPAAHGQAVCAHALGRLGQAIKLYEQALKLDSSLKAASDGLRKAREAQDRGVMYYLFDRNEQALARQSIIGGVPGARSYPYSALTAHLSGARSERFGVLGLEKTFEKVFPGIEVALTLDVRIQEQASKAMGWRKGAVVVLDPNTGEVLAAVSQPSYKPEEMDKKFWNVRDNPNRPLLNRAFEGLFEPGSICKIITTAAALEANVDMSRLFPMSPDTAIMIDGKLFRDWEDHGRIRSLKEAMDVSSNIAMYKVASAMGPDRLFEFINRFGFNQPYDFNVEVKGLGLFEIPIATSRAPLSAGNQFELAERACGLGKEYRVTPLHAALMAAAIANKGVMMKPKLVKQVRNLAGQVLYESKPEVMREVMKPETAEKIRQIMVDAVEGDRGIGRKARVRGITVAGKTGTARTKPSGGLDAWFICFAPADKPLYAIAVLADGEGTGMTIAAPIAGNLLRGMVR